MTYDTDVMLRILKRRTKEADALYYKIASRLNLSESAFLILYTISNSSNKCSQKDICAELSLSKATVDSAIQNICRKGFVNLERAPNITRKR